MKKINLWAVALLVIVLLGAGSFVNEYQIGDNTSTGNKFITFRTGLGASDPKIGFNPVTNKMFQEIGGVQKGLASGSGSGSGVNLLSDKNGDFEDGHLLWANTGLTYSVSSYATPSASNLQFAVITATAITQELASATVNLPTNFGLGCEAQIDFNALAGNQNFTLKVFDGATLLASQILTGTGSWVKSPILPFACSATMTLSLQTAGAGNISIDNAYLGSTRGISNIADIVTDWKPFVMTIKDTNGTSVKAPITLVDEAKYRRVGDSIEIEFSYYNQTSVGIAGVGAYTFGLPNALVVDMAKVTAGVGNSGNLYGHAKGDVGGAFKTNYQASPSSNGVIFNSASGAVGSTYSSFNNTYVALTGSFRVPIVGWSTNPYKIYSPDVTSFHSEGSIHSPLASLTTTATPLEISTPSAVMDKIIGSVGIVCSDGSLGNATCTTGNETYGFWAQVPVSGKYRIKMNAILSPSSATTDGYARIYETTANGATNILTGQKVCGVYSGAGRDLVVNCNIELDADLTAGIHYFRFKAIVSVGYFLVLADSTSGREFNFSIDMLGQHVAQPIIQNMVSSSVVKGTKIESCKVLKTGVPVSGSASCDSWINSYTNVVAGRTVLNLKAGVFTSNPNCTVSTQTNLLCADFDTLAPTNTSIKVGTNTCNTNVNTDTNFYIICIGDN